MRNVALGLTLALAVVLGVAACSDDVNANDNAACKKWDAIQGTQVRDQAAADELHRIGDLAADSAIRARALALATDLETGLTQPEIHIAYEDMDAACAALPDGDLHLPSTEVMIAIATLALGALGVVLTRYQARNQRETEVHASFMVMYQTFLERPELRAVFYPHEKPDDYTSTVSADTILRANTLADHVLDTIEMALATKHTRKMYRDWTAWAFQNSEHLRAWASTYVDHYSNEVQSALRVANESARSGSGDPPAPGP